MTLSNKDSLLFFNTVKEVLIFFKPLLFVFCISFGTGLCISFYGHVCGIHFNDPSSWWSSIFLIGTPICTRLSSLIVWLHEVVINSWLCVGALMFASVLKYIPDNLSHFLEKNNI